MIKRVYNRPGSLGKRNAGNASSKTRNGSEIDSSGRKVRTVRKTDRTQKGFESRNRLERTGEKRRTGQQETRDSQREPARGQSEFAGNMNKRLSRTTRPIRTARSATKQR